MCGKRRKSSSCKTDAIVAAQSSSRSQRQPPDADPHVRCGHGELITSLSRFRLCRFRCHATFKLLYPRFDLLNLVAYRMQGVSELAKRFKNTSHVRLFLDHSRELSRGSHCGAGPREAFEFLTKCFAHWDVSFTMTVECFCRTLVLAHTRRGMPNAKFWPTSGRGTPHWFLQKL